MFSLLPYSKELRKGKDYTIELHIDSQGQVEMEIHNVHYVDKLGSYRTNLAKMYKDKETGKTRYIVWQSDNYFDVKEEYSLDKFGGLVELKIADVYDWQQIVNEMKAEYDLFVAYYNACKLELGKALMAGANIDNQTKLARKRYNRNNKYFAMYESSSVLALINKMDKQIYYFELSKEEKVKRIQIDLFNKMVKHYDDDFWCKCDKQGEAEYVEGYKNTSHGWICSKCKRYVQVG